MLKVEYQAGFFDGEGSIGIYKNGNGIFHLRTQLTQNILPTSTILLEEFKNLYGGNLSQMKSSIYRNGAAYNWQLNGIGAVTFLQTLLPFLVLKKEQATVALSWFKISQKPERDSNGRYKPHIKNRPIDIKYSELLKLLKRSSLNDIIESQSEYKEICYEHLFGNL